MPKLTLLPQDFNQHPGIYLTALMLAVIAVAYLIIMSPILGRPMAVSNYDECVSLPNSVIQEKYPAVCVTADGQQFTQPTPQASPSGAITN